MLAIVLRALRTRRSQAITLLAIALVVAAAAVAAPLFVFAAIQATAQRDVAAAPAAQRLLSASQDVNGPGAAADPSTVWDRLRRYPPLPGFTAVAGYRVRAGATGAPGRPGTNSPMAYRDGLCAHVTLQGRCPDTPGTAAVSSRTAAALGVGVGDQIQLAYSGVQQSLRLTVAGVYRPRDSNDPYWGPAGGLLASTVTGAAVPGSPPPGGPDAVFVSRDTLLRAGAGIVGVTLDLVLSPDALSRQSPAHLADAVARRSGLLSGDQFQVATAVPALTARILSDQQLIRVAVPLLAGQVVVLGWYALFLAVTSSAAARRTDVGLLKIRGVAGARIWAVLGGQSALPVLAGAPVGAALGWLAARGLAGPVGVPAREALAVAAAAVAVAVLGGLLAAGLAERATMRAPAVDLLRRAPSARAARRWAVVDLAVVVLAAAGVYQVHANASGQVAGLVVLAPGLVALGAGLVAARVLVPLAARAVGGQLRAGRLRGALTATYLARRSRLDRVFALVVLAATLAGYAACAWDTQRTARGERIAQQLGAATVLSVQASTRTALLRAVRAADPGGRYAMAAVRSYDTTGQLRVLAVDATRLAAVAQWLPGYGRSAREAARLLHPAAPAPVMVTAAQLHLDVSADGLGTDPVVVLANLVLPDGQRQYAAFGPVRAGRRSYLATLAGCAAPPGCRLSGFALSTGATVGGAAGGPPAPGPRLVLHELRAGGSAVLPQAQLADRSRWRDTTDPQISGPVLAGAADGLAVEPPEKAAGGGRGYSGQVYVMDAPDALPVLAAGAVPAGGVAGAPQLSLFGTAAAPVRVAGRMVALPQLGTTGVLTDLEYADRLVDDAGDVASDDSHQPAGDLPGDLQVWLAPGAPAGLAARLRAGGLSIVAQQSAAEVGAQIDALGPVVALRFLVLAALLGLLLAAGSLILLATVDREPRAHELASLRLQGLSDMDVRAVVVSGYALLAGGSAVAGAVAAAVDRLLTAGSLPLFGDGWAVLAPPPTLRPDALLLGLVASLALLGGASVLAAYELQSAARTLSRHQ